MVQGEWSGYSLQVLAPFTSFRLLWAFHFYPYPENSVLETSLGKTNNL
jgi:hypothetical protein